MNESDPKLLDLQSALAEVQRLGEENVRLRRILQDHGIQLPVVQSPNGIPVTTSALPSPQTLVLKAEQRIALFRSLFHGRDDVYAVRWENADGRSGYMPKADRDWKAYLRARDEERKKVDRQTRELILSDLQVTTDGRSPLLLTGRTDHLKYFETELAGRVNKCSR